MQREEIISMVDIRLRDFDYMLRELRQMVALSGVGDISLERRMQHITEAIEDAREATRLAV